MNAPATEALIDCLQSMNDDAAWAANTLHEALSGDRDYWRTRALQAEARLELARDRLDYIIGG